MVWSNNKLSQFSGQSQLSAKLKELASGTFGWTVLFIHTQQSPNSRKTAESNCNLAGQQTDTGFHHSITYDNFPVIHLITIHTFHDTFIYIHNIHIHLYIPFYIPFYIPLYIPSYIPSYIPLYIPYIYNILLKNHFIRPMIHINSVLYMI